MNISDLDFTAMTQHQVELSFNDTFEEIHNVETTSYSNIDEDNYDVQNAIQQEVESNVSDNRDNSSGLPKSCETSKN